MTDADHAPEPWPGRKSQQQKAGFYEYKNVRFKLARSSRAGDGWHFQPFGREARDFASWDEAVAGLEEACVEIARQRAERRNR